MLGNYERDPDRFETMRGFAVAYLKRLAVVGEGEDIAVDALLSPPENAQQIMAGGTPDESTAKGKAQRALLNAWAHKLERENVMERFIASSQPFPRRAQYARP